MGILVFYVTQKWDNMVHSSLIIIQATRNKFVQSYVENWLDTYEYEDVSKHFV